MGQLELTAGRYRSLRLGDIAGDLTALLARAEANEVSYLAFEPYRLSRRLVGLSQAAFLA